MNVYALWNGCLSWLFPCTCAACAINNVRPEQPICYQCLSELQATQYQTSKHDELEKMFWGRIQLEYVKAEYPLKKGTTLQQTLHQFKYHHRPGIGIYLGMLAGKKLKSMHEQHPIDALIPLPLHSHKQRKRGYNQAERICAGLSISSGIPVWNDILYRNHATETQTRKDREERWNNMLGKFSLKRTDRATYKHLLLVDDVITTGATLEAAGHTLLQIPEVRLSFFALAHTESTGS